MKLALQSTGQGDASAFDRRSLAVHAHKVLGKQRGAAIGQIAHHGEQKRNVEIETFDSRGAIKGRLGSGKASRKLEFQITWRSRLPSLMIDARLSADHGRVSALKNVERDGGGGLE